jgi:uncharacterized protein (DUF58 family)
LKWADNDALVLTPEIMTLLASSTFAQKPRRLSSKTAGYLLNKSSFAILTGILLFAGWNSQYTIVLLVSLFLSGAGLARLWSHFSLIGVRCHRHISDPRIFPGEELDLKIQIFNRKPLPLPWIQIEDQVPVGLDTSVSTLPDPGMKVRVLRRSAALFWYSVVNWKLTLKGEKRGYYRIGPATVSSGDMFGFYVRFMSIPEEDYVTVYPKIFPYRYLEIPSLHPMGESKAPQPLFQDPARTIGVRDYQSYDSLRNIHWKASARCQKLQAKVYESTTTLKVALFLDVESFIENGSLWDEDFELGISVAASVANHMSEQGSPVGLYVNTRLADSGEAVSIAPGGSRRQITDILDSLAKVTSKSSSPFEPFFEAQRKRLNAGTTLLLIFARPPESLQGLLSHLKGSGHKILVLLIGDHGEIRLGEVLWKRVRNPNIAVSTSAG